MTRWIRTVTKSFRMRLKKSGNENEEDTRRGGNSEMERAGERELVSVKNSKVQLHTILKHVSLLSNPIQ